MFHFFSLMKAMSIPFIYMIVVGFMWGFFPNINMEFMLILLFFPTYILIGILAPKFNKETPYFSSFIGSLTLSVLNILGGQYIYDFDVMVNPDGINRSLVMSTGISVMTTYIYLSIRRKKVLKDV
ncbi:MAG: hypothetical protein ACO1OT_02115 [Heyndrickxia sp.]